MKRRILLLIGMQFSHFQQQIDSFYVHKLFFFSSHTTHSNYYKPVTCTRKNPCPYVRVRVAQKNPRVARHIPQWKISAEDEGRMPVSFQVSSSTQQSTIEENWGESKITPKRQANIDFYLLRFIVCCFVAFSLLDSGFFIDFVFALYVTPSLFSFSC